MANERRGAGNMRRKAKLLFNADIDDLMPIWMAAGDRPNDIAIRLGVYVGSPLNWLKTHGWQYIDGQWVAPWEEVADVAST